MALEVPPENPLSVFVDEVDCCCDVLEPVEVDPESAETLLR